MLGTLIAEQMIARSEMETAFLEILKASPVAVAMIFLVRIFLSALDKRDERFDTITKGVIEQNNKVITKNTEIISACKYVQQLRSEEK